MKKPLQKLLLLSLFLLPLVYPSIALAQPTYRCEWAERAPRDNCRVRRGACPAGYEPGSDCRRYDNERDCENAGPFPCARADGTGDYFQPSTCNTCSPDDPGCDPDDPAMQGIETALGCIGTHPLIFTQHTYRILLGVGGGIAFLLMIIGAFFVLSSQGDPERVKRGKEVFVGALVGLLIMIFSVFLLNLIGVDILGLF